MPVSAFDELRSAADEVLQHFAAAIALDAERRVQEADVARDRGGRLLYSRFSRWFQRHYQRLGLDESAAQDLTQEAFLKIFAQAGRNGLRSNAFALICAVRRSAFLDHVKHHRADKRSVGEQSAELQLSDDEWLALGASAVMTEPAGDLADCVQRKLIQYRARAPGRAEILELLCFGLNAREIAAAIYGKPEPEVSAQEAANMRDRIYNTRNQARDLFAECQEGA